MEDGENKKKRSREEELKEVKIEQESPQKKIKREDIVVPSYSSWFDMTKIHDIEKRALPEFFKNTNNLKNEKLYKEYRDYMIQMYERDSSTYLSATECRKALSGDVCSIMRVHAFLEHWGLINFGVVKNKLDGKFYPRYYDVKNPINSFYKEISQEEKPIEEHGKLLNTYQQSSGWTEKETLRLLKAVSDFESDWDKISEVVKTKSKEECILYFARMPIEDPYLNPKNLNLPEKSPKKEVPLPFCDTSNPIMTTIAFLSSVVSPVVAAAAAKAAQRKYAEIEEKVKKEKETFDLKDLNVKELCSAAIGAAAVNSKYHAEKEEKRIQRAVNLLLSKQIEKVKLKLEYLKQMEILMEKEKKKIEEQRKAFEIEKLEYMKNKTGNGNLNSHSSTFDDLFQ